MAGLYDKTGLWNRRLARGPELPRRDQKNYGASRRMTLDPAGTPRITVPAGSLSGFRSQKGCPYAGLKGASHSRGSILPSGSSAIILKEALTATCFGSKPPNAMVCIDLYSPVTVTCPPLLAAADSGTGLG